ncbi:hypothetical protein [Anabaena sp. AL09]|jgi:hypothetical protein|uniref:hypothetical protein n=1 Tax=Anabaena sp. AL09 TaxID=1710891 RepID=UPI002635B06C|nr:hypothetical protein [Anabaena sp. AL09]
MNSQLDVGAGFSRPQSLPVALFLSDEYGFNEPRRSEGSEGRKEEEEEEKIGNLPLGRG